MFVRGPFALPGQRIGLLGGSFDPPHEGHVHITRWALRRLALDRVWWLVSPGNPLKASGPAEIRQRLASCRKIMQHPRVDITDIERRLGSPYTAHTLASLRRRHPGVRWIWLMGADNLSGFHRWQSWTEIVETTPIAVMARPGEQLRAAGSPAARRYGQARLRQRGAAGLGNRHAPAWVLLTGPMSPASSTAIRRRGDWP